MCINCGKIQGIYFEISALYFEIHGLYFYEMPCAFCGRRKNEYSTACFAVSRCFDVSERRVFFAKRRGGLRCLFQGVFLAGMNRKMCVAEILVLKSVKFISGRFNYIVNFALYKIISLKRFFSENKKLHYAA